MNIAQMIEHRIDKKAKSAEASARWRRRHPEAARAAVKRCVEKNRDAVRATKYMWREKNIAKVRASHRVYWLKNSERVLARSRKKNGLPAPTRPCPEVCECCGKPSGNRAMSLDHCHETGAFRGWLCNKCNGAIGMLGDDLDGLMKAVSYLHKFQQLERIK